ncbi:MAG: hypothetical protein JSW54_12220 [Fidelibacterota bacterium]|nr:MAG: hypothetical protein JSW54_12220 [Candidatus Neomarinimicrobiota bacterium]
MSNFGNQDIAKHSIGLTLYPPLLLGIDYNYRCQTQGGRAVDLHSEIQLPLFLIEHFDSGKLRVGLSTFLSSQSSLGVTLSAKTSLAVGRHILGRTTAWGISLAVHPGFYGDRRFLALDLEIDVGLASYLDHSDYHSAFFEGLPNVNAPDASWYIFPNTRYIIAVEYGVINRKQISFSLAVGIQLSPQSQGIYFFPQVGITSIYAPVNLSYHF